MVSKLDLLDVLVLCRSGLLLASAEALSDKAYIV